MRATRWIAILATGLVATIGAGFVAQNRPTPAVPEPVVLSGVRPDTALPPGDDFGVVPPPVVEFDDLPSDGDTTDDDTADDDTADDDPADDDPADDDTGDEPDDDGGDGGDDDHNDDDDDDDLDD